MSWRAIAAIVSATLYVALGLALWTPGPSHAFSSAMPAAPAIPQGAIAARSDLAARLEPAQRLGAALPLELPFTDSRGKLVWLKDYFGERPVVFVLGYYQCPDLCGIVMQGVLEALVATGLPASAWRIVYVSVDPTETSEMAAAKRESWLGYMKFLRESEGGAGAAESAATAGHSGAARLQARPATVDGLTESAPDAVSMQIDTLVGDESSTTAIARAAGFAVEPVGSAAPPGHSAAARSQAWPATVEGANVATTSDPTSRTLSRYSHAAEFMIVTPDGDLAKYELGVRYDPRNLRLAIVDASHGRVGTVADRLVLLCSHFDPATGQYDSLVMNVLRAIGIATVLGLGTYAWRHRRPSLNTDTGAAA